MISIPGILCFQNLLELHVISWENKQWWWRQRHFIQLLLVIQGEILHLQVSNESDFENGQNIACLLPISKVYKSDLQTYSIFSFQVNIFGAKLSCISILRLYCNRNITLGECNALYFYVFLEDDGMDPEYSERSYSLDLESNIGYAAGYNFFSEPTKFYSSFMPAPAALVF